MPMEIVVGTAVIILARAIKKELKKKKQSEKAEKRASETTVKQTRYVFIHVKEQKTYSQHVVLLAS